MELTIFQIYQTTEMARAICEPYIKPTKIHGGREDEGRQI